MLFKKLVYTVTSIFLQKNDSLSVIPSAVEGLDVNVIKLISGGLLKKTTTDSQIKIRLWITIKVAYFIKLINKSPLLKQSRLKNQ